MSIQSRKGYGCFQKGMLFLRQVEIDASAPLDERVFEQGAGLRRPQGLAV
jgi:hypothetical protein